MTLSPERKATIDVSVRAAETLSAQAANPFAERIWRFVRAFACYAEPLPSAPETFEIQQHGWVSPDFGKRRGARLHIVALAASDIGMYGRTWDQLHTGKGVAIFFPRANLILLRADRAETPPVLGCSLLHEGGHALRRDDRRQTGDQDPPPFSPAHLAEERDMHTLEGILWRAQNPSRYDLAIDKGIYWIQRELRRQRRGIGEIFVGLPSYPALLDDILGPAPTEQARGDRKIHFDILANFAAVDHSARTAKEVLKANMMESLYQFVGFTGVLG